MKIYKHKCPKCEQIDNYNQKDIDNALKRKGEIVVRATCSNCGYKSELFYKQVFSQ